MIRFVTNVLDTVLKPAHSYEITAIAKLLAIMIIRTVLAYFLNLVMKELIEESMHSHVLVLRGG